MYLYSDTVQYYYTECKADASRWYFLIVILELFFVFFFTLIFDTFEAVFYLSPLQCFRPVVL